MFQFNVAKEAFVLHSKLVSRHSPALHALMCGHMMKAEEKQTFISNVDKDTFARFAEFIYGGDYNVAEALIVLDNLDTERRRSESDSPRPLEIDVEEIPDPPSPEDAADPPPLDENDWSPPRNSKKKRKRGIQIPVRNRLPPFADFSLPAVDNVSFPEIHDHEAVSDTGLMYDYAEALCHVQLYVFAEKYQINDLKDLVIRKLHKALMDTAFHPLRVGEFVELIQLAYENTPDLKSKEEPLRNLLAHYAAWNFEELAPTSAFQDLLIAGGTFVNDLCQKICRRL
jgi:hypothetical protein